MEMARRERMEEMKMIRKKKAVLSSCNFFWLKNLFKLSMLLTVAKSSLGLDLWIGVWFPQNVFLFFLVLAN